MVIHGQQQMTGPASNSLSQVAKSKGFSVASAGNRPIRLDDPDVAWFVETGGLDVFLTEYRDGAQVSNAKHLLRAGPGRLVFGVGNGDGSLVATAKGLPDTDLRRLRLEDLERSDLETDLSGQLDAWVSDVGASVSRQIEPRPRIDLLLDSSPEQHAHAIDAGAVVSVRPGRVLWVRPEDPTAAYLGTETLGEDGEWLPLTSDTWLSNGFASSLNALPTRKMFAEGKLFSALPEFHRLALGAEQFNRRVLVADVANEQVARTVHRRQDREDARQTLFNVMNRRDQAAEVGGSDLMATLIQIGKREGIDFRMPPPRGGRESEGPSLDDILDVSVVRSRKVRLSQDDRWWLGDSGAMLGFREADGQPLALLPDLLGRYRAFDPSTGRSFKVNSKTADEIDHEAWFFYRPLPEDRAVNAVDLLWFAGKSMVSDLVRFAISGLLAGVLMLAPAVALGILADRILPTLSGNMLVQITIALVVFALVGVALLMVQGTAMMRLEGRTAARLSAATWDRLLRLRPGFYREYTAGDLAVRMSVFQVLRDQVSGAVANALLSIVFLAPTLGLLFFYDTGLAWLSIAVGLLALLATACFGFFQIKPHRRRYAAARHLSGELFQFINGMNKLRSAGAEPSAFASWARGYRQQHLAGIQIGRFNEPLVAFNAAIPALAAALLFIFVLLRGADGPEMGDFLVVYAVSMTFYTAVVGFGRSFEALAALAPGYEQVKPVLNELPQGRADGLAPTELNGEIHFDHVSFRYSENGPLIIDDVSIHARPGEFVAIVGESGAGKSTLVQLALGLEQPSSGGVYYDGRDLSHHDPRVVRRQIGVVMQDGALQPGNILDNIIGLTEDLTIDDAWRAARLAAVDQDLNAMPMGMFTPVSDGSTTFSGGQVQRIRIAAALVRRPRIVFLDEATSWLDARSQAEVMRGLDNLAATRIVIAHRLSTIRRAERIYVLERGRVVQQGTFNELFEMEGAFRTLALRQMA